MKFKTPSEKRKSRFDFPKAFYPCLWKMRIVPWPHWGKFFYFFTLSGHQFSTLVTENSKNYLKIMGLQENLT